MIGSTQLGDRAAVGDRCPNCEAPRQGRYCFECGQDNRSSRLEVREIAAEVWGNLVGWDGKLWRTLRVLALDPARLVEDYAAGRRQRYLNPARFCLIALALWLLITNWFGLDVMDQAGITFNTTGEASERAEAVAHAVKGLLTRHLELLLYLALPLRAALVQLLFRRSARTYAENLALVFYLAGFGYLLALCLVPVAALVWRGAAALRWAISFVWFVRALRGFHRRGWYATSWRAAVVLFLHVITTAALFAAIIVPFVLIAGP